MMNSQAPHTPGIKLRTLFFSCAAFATALNCSPCSVYASPPAAAAPLGSSTKEQDPIVAKFADQTIRESELKQEIESKPVFAMTLQKYPDKADRVRNTALNNMVNRRLLLKDAEKNGARDEAREQAFIDEVEKSYGGRAKLDELLISIHTSHDKFISDIKSDFRLQSYINEVIGKDLKVNEEELKKAYEADPSHFAIKPSVNARHILVKADKGVSADKEAAAKQKIDGIRAQLVKPEAKFEEIAKTNSDDTGSAAKGGSLGTFGPGEMVPEFEAVAFKIKPGEISEAFRSQYGYHIVKVDERKEGQTLSFESAKGAVEQELKTKKKEVLVNDKIKSLRETSKTVINLADPKPDQPQIRS